ncbi:MAG: signal peptide peptidase SppA [Chloroflexota bacterium]
MSDANQTPLFDLNGVLHSLQSTAVSFVNMQRQNAGSPIHYVQFNLPSQLNALPVQRNFIEQQFLGKAPFSLVELESAFNRIANDSRPRGVILYFRSLAMSLAELQSLRDAILRLKGRGKKIIAFAQDYGLAEYYVASAADEIIIQPSGTLNTVGLLRTQTFLKEGLEEIGLQADSVAISPYKGAADTFTRTEPSDEGKEQINWLLDSQFQQLVSGIAEERSMTHDEVMEMINTAPHLDTDAAEKGYVDAQLNEEGLQGYLETDKILLWEQADGMLPLSMPRDPSQYVAVVRAAGTILPGESQNPPVDLPIPILGGETLGDATLTRQVRNLLKDEKCVAMVLFVDSPGGSASASEAMAAALEEFAKKKPIVVYMHSVAASGGYYISTPADYIIAQPGTITGSIGVIFQKFVTSDLIKKLRFNPYYYQRGDNADILAGTQKFNDEQREKVRSLVERIYDVFVERVAQSRKMKTESVDAISGGRVWTGQQALENGLVDELGGLYEALNKARELAKVPMTTPFGVMRGGGKPLPAQVTEQADPAARLQQIQNRLEAISGTTLMLMPFEIK